MVTQGQIDQVERDIRAAEQDQQRLERAIGSMAAGSDIASLQRELKATIANVQGLRKRKAGLLDQKLFDERQAGRGAV